MGLQCSYITPRMFPHLKPQTRNIFPRVMLWCVDLETIPSSSSGIKSSPFKLPGIPSTIRVSEMNQQKLQGKCQFFCLCSHLPLRGVNGGYCCILRKTSHRHGETVADRVGTERTSSEHPAYNASDASSAGQFMSVLVSFPSSSLHSMSLNMITAHRFLLMKKVRGN